MAKDTFSGSLDFAPARTYDQDPSGAPLGMTIFFLEPNININDATRL